MMCTPATMSGGRGSLAAVAPMALLALAFVCCSQAASLGTHPIPSKDKKSPEVIYYEGAADDSRVDKRVDKSVDKSIAAAAIAWPSFREELRSKERASASAAAAAAAAARGKEWLAYGAGKSGGAERPDAVDIAGYVDDNAGGDKALLAEALMQMLMDELEGGGGGGEGDEAIGDDGDYASDDEVDEEAAAAAAAAAADEEDDEEEIPEAKPPRELDSTARADAVAGAAAAAPKRPRPAASATKTTRAPETTTAAAAAAAESDGPDDEKEDADSREDKRVRVNVSGGLPDGAAKPADENSADDKATGGEDGTSEDPYREYLDMWYRTNIAEDYEEDSLSRLRSYLEYLKFAKASEKKPRTKSAAVPQKSSGAGVRSGKSEPPAGGSRKKRSLLDGGAPAYISERGQVGSEGVYLTAAEAQQLRRLVVGLNEQNNKYAATLRNLLAADDGPAGRDRYPEVLDRDDYEESNKNLYRLAYGLADPYVANVGY